MVTLIIAFEVLCELRNVNNLVSNPFLDCDLLGVVYQYPALSFRIPVEPTRKQAGLDPQDEYSSDLDSLRNKGHVLNCYKARSSS